MDRMGFWNVRGLNSLSKEKEIKWFFYQNKVGLFSLLETRVKASNWNKVHNNICSDWAICTNNTAHKGGRIWLLWLPGSYCVDVVDMTAQTIHARVLDKARRWYFWLTSVYGFNKLVDRRPLWQSLRRYSVNCLEPWVVWGDFNNVLFPNERMGSVVSWAEIRDFQECLNTSNLHDAKVVGSFFTWNNKWDDEDRVLAGLIGFCCWAVFVSGTPMYQLTRCLKRVKEQLKVLNRERFSDVENWFSIAHHALLKMQDDLNKNPLDFELGRAEKALACEVATLHKARNLFLQQRAKCQWLGEGDDSTAYFRSSIKKRKQMNKVLQIRDVNGILQTDPLGIQRAFEDFYLALLGSSNPVTAVHVPTVQNGNLVTDAHCQGLMAPITGKEIRDAMFSIPDDKAPGPDGFTSQFYKDAWGIVGVSVIKAVQSFFGSGKLLKEINHTLVTLVLKVEIPVGVAQFRPIACCNTLYKCITKVLSSRLGRVLPDIISSNQSAFIKGRDIVENVLICQDLVRLYGRRSCSPRILMKIDLMKAYDSIEWEFLGGMLQALGFPTQFIDDLLMFSYGDYNSATLLLREFLTFSNASGLRMNVQNSSLYANGVPSPTVQRICAAAGMNLGALPFTYWGIPITSRKLSVLECFVLIEKVVARIRAVDSRYLSYGCRLTLVKSVLSTLHSYWARIFIIPKSIIKRIEDTCMNFLWRGSHIYVSAPPIAWDQVCKEPEMGGLGIRKAYEWNIVSVGKYIWWLASKKDHLWVKWINGTYLRGKDWRDMKSSVTSTWSWKWMCHVKEALVAGFLGDWWLRVGKECTVQQGYQWLTRGGTVVPWSKFVTWMAMHQRLYTKTHLAWFGVGSDGLCCLCAGAEETQAHLFFDCPYSRNCVRVLSDKLGMSIPWTDTWLWWNANRF
ncbi:hypothetical protein RND81_07G023700 [Saponaria officinalis]|uniref:Reverse transcriptase domain-containing protein n=1 Tax=Saponaria officinalis TaxID=3572 RepID=A0AAW1JL51_SAPOF